MPQFDIGKYTYDAGQNYYHLRSTRLTADADRSDLNDRVKSYDHLLHQSLDKIFSEHCLNDSDQIKEFFLGPRHHTDQESIIKPILGQEPFLSVHFSKEELGKLSLLWIAVLCCYEKSAELLVRSGADVNELFGRHDPQVIDEKSTVLHVLLQMDPSPENERLVRLVINHGADLQARDSRGRTALLHAVVEGRVQMIELLLEEGADINAGENDGITPVLAAACKTKSNELVPLLMKHGADIFAKSRRGANILHCLAGSNLKHTVDLARVCIEKGVSLDDWMILRDVQYQPIHIAAMKGKDELVKLYLDHGAKVNEQNVHGVSPLQFAALFCNYAVVKTLLDRGANIEPKMIKGRTALHATCLYAVRFTSRNVEDNKKVDKSIKLLLSAGADVLAEDCDGNTPLALISSGENAEPPGIRRLIKELALKKALQPSIELKDERIIERYPKLQDYYRKCTDEINRMKSTRFIETCTFFQLLAKSYCNIAKLMRNPEFVPKFKLCDLNDGFSIYAEDILRAFVRGKSHYQRMLKQKDLIYEAVYNILPDLVVDKVVHRIFNCCKNVK